MRQDDIVRLLFGLQYHRPPGDASRIHGFFRARIVQEGLRVARFIPFKDQRDVIGIIHIAVKLIDARRASRPAIGLIGIEAHALLVVISHIDTEIDVDHVSLSFS